MTYSIPFTELTWLCAPGRAPRLVGAGPGPLAGVTLSARDARVAGDFRSFELDDAQVLLPVTPPAVVQVKSLSMHGLAPFARGSTLSAPLRALIMGWTAWLSASLAAYMTLRGAARTRAHALFLGAAGPIAALGLVRLLETSNARALLFALVPVAAGAAALAAGGVASRLRLGRLAATSQG